jgi:hypothetical protein
MSSSAICRYQPTRLKTPNYGKNGEDGDERVAGDEDVPANSGQDDVSGGVPIDEWKPNCGESQLVETVHCAKAGEPGQECG